MRSAPVVVVAAAAPAALAEEGKVATTRPYLKLTWSPNDRRAMRATLPATRSASASAHAIKHHYSILTFDLLLTVTAACSDSETEEFPPCVPAPLLGFQPRL